MITGVILHTLYVIQLPFSRQKRNESIENNNFEKAAQKHIFSTRISCSNETDPYDLLGNKSKRFGGGGGERSECDNIRALTYNTRVLLYRRLRETFRCNKTSSVRHKPKSRNAITRDKIIERPSYHGNIQGVPG